MILSNGIVLSAEPREGPPSAPTLLSHTLLHSPFSPSLWNDGEASNGIRRRVRNRAEQQLLPLGGQPPLTSLPHCERFSCLVSFFLKTTKLLGTWPRSLLLFLFPSRLLPHLGYRWKHVGCIQVALSRVDATPSLDLSLSPPSLVELALLHLFW